MARGKRDGERIRHSHVQCRGAQPIHVDVLEEGRATLVDENQQLLCGIDVGGTFTDLILINTVSTQVFTEKILTTSDDPSRAILQGIRALMLRLDDKATMPSVRLVHATTLLTNALIERKGARTALLTTEGFRDVLDIRRENRYNIFDLAIQFPEPLVPWEWRWEIRERIGPTGDLIEPLDCSTLASVASDVREQEIESVAVGFLHSYANPAHEQAVGRMLKERLPDTCVTISSEVAPHIREYERLSTTIVNAYIMPILNQYLRTLSKSISSVWPDMNLSMMVSNGGVCSPETALDFPVRLLESGPAAGALTATHYGRKASLPNLLAFDMGGTTAKLCVIQDNSPSMTSQFEAAQVARFQRGSGIPILIPSIDLMEIGAGGGSIAGIDRLNLLEVGPRSAGSKPGPASYGLGGAEPTVTDADLILGYLSADYFLGGRMQLCLEAAIKAVSTCIAEPLHITVMRASWGIHDLVNENMASAARLHMAEKGLDPRSFALLATGGAGPVHACHLAMKLGIRHVLCPPSSGVASALGLLVAPPRADVSHSFLAELHEIDWNELNKLITNLTTEAMETLIQAGVDPATAQVIPLADMRYVGQSHHIETRIPSGKMDEESKSALRTAFEESYHQLYGSNLSDIAVELTAIRITVLGPTPDYASGVFVTSTDTDAPIGERTIYVAEHDKVRSAPIYRRDALSSNSKHPGPAIVESEDTTTVVESGWQFWVDADRVLHLQH